MTFRFIDLTIIPEFDNIISENSILFYIKYAVRDIIKIIKELKNIILNYNLYFKNDKVDELCEILGCHMYGCNNQSLTTLKTKIKKVVLKNIWLVDEKKFIEQLKQLVKISIVVHNFEESYRTSPYIINTTIAQLLDKYQKPHNINENILYYYQNKNQKKNSCNIFLTLDTNCTKNYKKFIDYCKKYYLQEKYNDDIQEYQNLIKNNTFKQDTFEPSKLTSDKVLPTNKIYYPINNKINHFQINTPSCDICDSKYFIKYNYNLSKNLCDNCSDNLICPKCDHEYDIFHKKYYCTVASNYCYFKGNCCLKCYDNMISKSEDFS